MKGATTRVVTNSPAAAETSVANVAATTSTVVLGNSTTADNQVKTVHSMSGIQALAAAAAATQKMNVSPVTNAIRIASPLTPVRAATNIRIQNTGTTVLRQASPQLAGKQLFIQKPLPQGQIVTLVKTSQGMTVATVPKGSLVQAGKTATGTSVLPQTAKSPTIVKLVPNTVGGNKVLTTMKTIPPNMIQMNKAGKQTIVISKSGNQIARGTTPQVLVVSSGSGIRTTIQTVSSQQSANSSTSTTSINLNPVASAGGTQQTLSNVKIAGKPITITMPVSSLHGAQGKPVTITKHAVTLGNTGQIINVPNQSVQVI